MLAAICVWVSFLIRRVLVFFPHSGVKRKPSLASCKSKLLLSTQRKLIRKERKPACLSFDQVMDTSGSCFSGGGGEIKCPRLFMYTCSEGLINFIWVESVSSSKLVHQRSVNCDGGRGEKIEKEKETLQGLYLYLPVCFCTDVCNETKRILILSNKSLLVPRGISFTLLQVFSFQVATSSSFAYPPGCLSYLGLKIARCEALPLFWQVLFAKQPACIGANTQGGREREAEGSREKNNFGYANDHS